jgi:hypothetical protein
VPWPEQSLLMEVPHVHAMALACSSLLIESVPVAETFTAHNFLPVFCRNHKATCTTPERHSAEPVPSTCTLRRARVATRPSRRVET